MAYALVQSKKDTLPYPYTTLSVPFTSNVVSGHLIVVGVRVRPYTLTATVTDSQGNTYASASPAASQGSSFNYYQQFFYAIAGSSAACTVTVTPTGSGGPSQTTATIYEFSGNASGTAVDGAGSSGTTNPSSITTTQASDLIVAMGTSYSPVTAGSGFTSVSTVGSGWYEVDQYKLDGGASGAVSVPFTDSGGSLFSSAAFKIVAGGGTTKTVTTTLVASPTDSTPVASLTGIKWVFFDQVAGATFNAPIDQGTTATTNGSGVCVITLTNSVKTNGQVGTLGLMYSDGTVAYANRGMMVPVTVVVS